MKVLAAAGGTAGHVNPMLATADQLARRGHEVLAVGTRTGLEAELVPAAGLELYPIARIPLPRKPSGDLFRLPGRLKGAVDDLRGVLRDRDIHAVQQYVTERGQQNHVLLTQLARLPLSWLGPRRAEITELTVRGSLQSAAPLATG